MRPNTNIRKFLKNPIKGQKTLLQAIDVTSDLIQRFGFVEKAYCIVENDSNLGSSIIELYRLILVFQARVLRHFHHRTPRQILSDTFKPTQWEGRLNEITDQEKQCNILLQDDTANEIRKESERIRKMHSDFKTSFKGQQDAIRVSSTQQKSKDQC